LSMKRRLAIIGGFVSGLCLYLALSHVASLLAWVAVVPLFLVTYGEGELTGARGRIEGGWVDRRRFLPGFVAGATLSVFAFAWMIPGARAFTGVFMAYGVALFVLCVLAFAFGCGVLSACCPPPLTIPIWVLAETLLQLAAEKMPWFVLHVGSALASDLYAIQPVSVVGVTGVSFVVVSVNYLVVLAIRRRSWILGLAPVLAFGCYMGWGWWLLPPDAASLGADRASEGASFPLAILTEQIPPEVAWDSSNGNVRVQQLLEQEDRCIAGHPRMILWAESAIPWTYSPGDDLIGEVLHRSRGQSIVHIIGMNTAVSGRGAGPGDGAGPGEAAESGKTAVSGGAAESGRVVRNSAYCLLANGRVAGRYDKITPLLFIEQPGFGLLFPFFSPDGYSVEPGDSDRPLGTPYGKAGVLICNESTLPGAAASRVRQGAQFLLNLSNDGWFRDTWLVDQHFYNARVRAVETRKDMVVNSNYGRSGCIHASGRIDTAGFLFMIYPNDKLSIAVRYPLIPVFICLLFILAIIVINKKPSLL
jgi:apolipoprotein N-acyltransferase